MHSTPSNNLNQTPARSGLCDVRFVTAQTRNSVLAGAFTLCVLGVVGHVVWKALKYEPLVIHGSRPGQHGGVSEVVVPDDRPSAKRERTPRKAEPTRTAPPTPTSKPPLERRNVAKSTTPSVSTPSVTTPPPMPAKKPPQPSPLPTAMADSKPADVHAEAALLERYRLSSNAAAGSAVSGERHPVYYLENVESWQEILKRGGAVVAYDSRSKLKLNLGHGLENSSKCELIRDWNTEMSNVVLRGAILDDRDERVASRLRQILADFAEFKPASTSLYVMPTIKLDKIILESQRQAFSELRCQSSDRYVTAGDLKPGFNGEVEFRIRVVMDRVTGAGWRRAEGSSRWEMLSRSPRAL